MNILLTVEYYFFLFSKALIFFSMSISKGRFFEKQAIKHLTSKGHEIIFKNFYTWCGEVDLITFYQGRVRFIEVKYLSKTKLIMPIDKIDLYKVRRIFLCISYLKKFCKFSRFQVDAISVYFKNNKLNFDYTEDLRLY
jgi:Holliday junction resolvase-like predicted endonuclease